MFFYFRQAPAPYHSQLHSKPKTRPHSATPALNAMLAAALFAASGAAQAKSITALTPSFFDVSKAIGSAVDGDTVIIPAGKASWTSQLVITKAITLMGKTTTDSVAGTAVDKTIMRQSTTNQCQGSLKLLGRGKIISYQRTYFPGRSHCWNP